MNAPSVKQDLRLHVSTSLPDNGRLRTAETANAPIIMPTWDSAPCNCSTMNSGSTANSKNMLPENRKVLRHTSRKSRVNNAVDSDAATGGDGGRDADRSWAGCDTDGESSEAVPV